MFQTGRAVLSRFGEQLIDLVIGLEICEITFSDRRRLANDDVISAHLVAWIDKPIKI
jgi:hypothetical protein